LLWTLLWSQDKAIKSLFSDKGNQRFLESKHDIVTGNYWPSSWYNEACSFFIENIIKQYGADKFMTAKIVGDENICNFANEIRNHL
jgi:hypothetical protein